MARKKLADIPQSRKQIGVLFSGGLDSAALIGHFLELDYDVWPVYVRSDLPWESVEIEWAQRFLRAAASDLLQPLGFATLHLEQAYDGNWSRTGLTPGADSRDAAVFLPARNLLLLTKAMLILSPQGVHDVALATLNGNPFADARPSYFKLLEKVLSVGFRHRVQILAPFRRKTKVEIIRAYHGFPLHLSTSCISPSDDAHCGKCNKCAERRRAFKKAEVRDRTVYRDGANVAAPALRG